MDPEFQKQLKRARRLSEAELYRQMATTADWAPLHVAADVELTRRESRRAFWRHDVWTWLAVFIALTSLSLSVLSLFRTLHSE
jgi:hypothetical protein